jgi:hypothetical protein
MVSARASIRSAARSVYSAENQEYLERRQYRARPGPHRARSDAAGLKAFRARKDNKSGIYSYEQRSVELEEPYDGLLKKNTAAWRFFRAQPASYRKAVSWWIISARKEETRLKRLEKLMAYSAQG